jgi:hypothetical protein
VSASSTTTAQQEEKKPLLSHHVKTACGSSADSRVVFAFFSNRLGCIGSVIVSIVGSLVLILVLRCCGAF